MRLIIAGGRDFNDYDLLCRTLDALLANNKKVVVLSGCARGADRLGERWARVRKHVVERYPANWKLHHKAAGPVRNEEMAKRAEMLVAFWDGISTGTADMIIQAARYGLKRHVIRYGDKEPRGLLD